MLSLILCALWGAVWYPIAMKMGFAFTDVYYWAILIFGSIFITAVAEK